METMKTMELIKYFRVLLFMTDLIMGITINFARDFIKDSM